MTVEEIIKAIAGLSESERAQLLGRISPSQTSSSSASPRLRQLLDKQGRCPHCGGSRYYRFGRDKGAQRFRCHDCGRTFTEYTGTWQSGLHRRDLASRYMSLMSQNKSLDKISSELRINKKTAFDWRHKILGTFRQDRGESFEGIVESDETFLYESEKGSRNLKRPARKRGGSGQKGITDKLVAVIVTADRRHSLNITSCGAGRLTKEMVSGSLVTPLPASTTLCSDGHTSYKGYASDIKIRHVVLRADIRQRVRQGVYHIQHVNSMHARLKRWIRACFCGVSTKYLQNYLNWFKVIETNLKFKRDVNKAMMELSMIGENVLFTTEI